MFMKRSATIVLLVSLFAGPLAMAAEWPRFRGVDGNGVTDDASLPVEFGPDKNLVWKTDVPFANSSPVLAGGVLYLTASDDENLLILALNANTGEVEWQHEITRARRTKVHAQNDSASPTPVVHDGKIFAFFQELGVVSYTTDGEHCWTLPLEPFNEYYGLAASPVVARDVVLLSCDQQQGSYLLAVDAMDGSIRWKADRAIRSSSWTTPAVFPQDGSPESVIVHGDNWIDAYALSDGAHLWGVTGFGRGPITSPALVGNRLYTTAPQWAENDGSGFQMETFDELSKSHDKNGDAKLTQAELKGNLLQGEFGWGDTDKDGFITQEEYEEIYEGFYSEDYGVTALELDPSNAKSKPRALWQYRGTLPNISTPLAYGDTIYFADKKGYINSVDAATGELVKRERIKGAGANYFASPIAADGKVYFAGMTGKVAVLEAEPEWAVLSVNDLGDRITATPVVANDRLYIRTKGAMFCFGERRD